MKKLFKGEDLVDLVMRLVDMLSRDEVVTVEYYRMGDIEKRVYEGYFCGFMGHPAQRIVLPSTRTGLVSFISLIGVDEGVHRIRRKCDEVCIYQNEAVLLRYAGSRLVREHEVAELLRQGVWFDVPESLPGLSESVENVSQVMSSSAIGLDSD